MGLAEQEIRDNYMACQAPILASEKDPALENAQSFENNERSIASPLKQWNAPNLPYRPFYCNVTTQVFANQDWKTMESHKCKTKTDNC